MAWGGVGFEPVTVSAGGGGAAAGFSGAVLAAGEAAGELRSAGFEGNGARTSFAPPAVGVAPPPAHQEYTATTMTETSPIDSR